MSHIFTVFELLPRLYLCQRFLELLLDVRALASELNEGVGVAPGGRPAWSGLVYTGVPRS